MVGREGGRESEAGVRAGGRAGVEGVRKQTLTLKGVGAGVVGRLGDGKRVALSSGLLAQDPSGLMICLGELIAAVPSRGSISSLCKQGRQTF